MSMLSRLLPDSLKIATRLPTLWNTKIMQFCPAAIVLRHASTAAKTVQTALHEWTSHLERVGVPEAQQSAELIMAHTLRVNGPTMMQLMHKPLSSTEKECYDKLMKKRLDRMPVQYIIEEWDFGTLTLKMRQPVFIPRPESEQLVEIALQYLKPTDTVVDLCCGSGCIALSLLTSLPELTCIAIDQSKEACELTKDNAALLGKTNLQVVQAKLTEDGLDGCDLQSVDAIVANPPYVPARYLHGLQPEISQYEDLRALDGGEDGLDTLKLVFPVASGALKPNGKLIMEVDESHPNILQQWLHDCPNLNLVCERTINDLFGERRFVVVTKNCH